MSEEEDFPIPTDVSAETEALSHAQKLELIAEEGQALYNYCIAKGFKNKELKECLSPLNSQRSKVNRIYEDSKKGTIGISVLVGLIAVLCYSDMAYNVFVIHAKLASMQVLPYWDWTYIYAEDCLINNPFFSTGLNITEELCEPCKNLTERGYVERLNNISQETMLEEFLWKDTPVIVEDCQREWVESNKTVLNMNEINKFTIDGKFSEKFSDCQFNTTIQNITSIHEFLNASRDNGLPKDKAWMTLWQNCDYATSKEFRKFYRRPYFFAANLAAWRSTQIFVANGISDNPKQYLKTYAGEELYGACWISVISGSVGFKLTINHQCTQFNCSAVTGILNAGDTLVVPLNIFRLRVKSNHNEMTIALLSGVTWDEM